jgi:hypothetical protein
MNVDVNNRQLHEKESKNLARLKQGRDKAAQDRLDDAMCALVKCSAGVPDGDPLKAELAASEQRGRSYKDEQDLIKQAGAFDGYSTRDQTNDFLLSRDEGIRRAQGVAQGVAGGAGVAGGVALAGTGAVTCAPTAGGGCAVAALGGVIAVKSAESGLDGFRTAVGPYQSTEGQRVKDSLDPETYPGERDRAAELGMDGARSALGYGLGKLAGRLAAGPAPVKGETSVATTASKAEPGMQGVITAEGTANAATVQGLKTQLASENIANIAVQDSRLAAAVNGSGKSNPNFSIGTGTATEANQLGQIWVGDGARLVSNQNACPGCLISADGTRIFRPPQPKSSPFARTGVQANFVQQTPTGTVISNGHLNVTP